MAEKVDQLLFAQISLSAAQAAGGNIRAFVQTDSKSPSILATLSECAGPFPAVMFCGARNFGGNDGIMITLTCPQGIPAHVTVTVSQVGAKNYHPPILYPGL